MAIELSFLGAIDTVTGSRYLVETGGARVLIDCGLFQGLKKLRERNWRAPSFKPSSLDAVVLTHAHIDHSGYLPKLCRDGFRGPIWCTDGTRDLLRILLPDSGHLQEEDARHANQYGYAHHRPALPLYTRDDAERCLTQLRPVVFHQVFEPARGMTASYTRAGHILGSGCLALEAGGVRVTFSGDVGRPADPVMRPPEPLRPADYLVVESTYGDRRHPPEDVGTVLAKLVSETAARGGTIVVPAFAVGRAQHLLHLLAGLRAAKRIPQLPIFLDSPMAVAATELYCKHKDDHRLSDAECTLMCKIATYTRTPDESKAIDRSSEPKIVVSASGMATGGRVLHHLQRFLPDERGAVLLVGYQSAGTRGRQLADGCDELKLHGQYVPVRARVVQIQGLSAHGDHAELIEWLRAGAVAPRRVFVTHGEPNASDSFRRRLVESLGWDATTPDLDGKTVLE